MTRVTVILEGDEYLIAEMERSERSKRSIESVTDDLDHDDEAETINDELNVDDRRLLQLLQDPYERLDVETRIKLENRGVDLTGVNYDVDNPGGS